MDAERLGRPSTSTTDEKLEEARAIILTDRRVTIEEIALQLGISQGMAYSLVHDILGFHKVARWVPRHLTEEHKHNGQHICTSLLERYSREGDNFLNRIVTGDETWVHHYEPETKRQSMQWTHTLSPSKKFKSQPSAGKLLMTVFWDSQGPILEHYMEKGVTVTSINYSNMLKNELRPAIRLKWRGRCSAVTRQCTLSYGTPHHQHHSATELGSPRAPCLQPRPGPFRFPSVWTPQERSKTSLICS